MAETAALEDRIPHGFVLARSLGLYITKGLLFSPKIEQLAQKFNINYRLNRQSQISRLNHRNFLRLTHLLGLRALSNKDFLTYREEVAELSRKSFLPYSWLSDVYDFEADRKTIRVYLNAVNFDQEKEIYTDENLEPIKPVIISGAQARSIKEGYSKYIQSYDENGIPIETTNNRNRAKMDRFWSSPVGIKAALRGWKRYPKTEQFLSLRDPESIKYSDLGKILIYAKMPRQ